MRSFKNQSSFVLVLSLILVTLLALNVKVNFINPSTHLGMWSLLAQDLEDDFDALDESEDEDDDFEDEDDDDLEDEDDDFEDEDDEDLEDEDEDLEDEDEEDDFEDEDDDFEDEDDEDLEDEDEEGDFEDEDESEDLSENELTDEINTGEALEPSEEPSDNFEVADNKLLNLEFRQLQDRVRVTLVTDKVISVSKNNQFERRQVILSLGGTSISQTLLKRALDTGEFDGPVAYVQAYQGDGETKVLVQLRKNVPPTISQQGTQIYIDFPINKTLAQNPQSSNPNQSYTDIGTGSSSVAKMPNTFLSINENTSFNGSKINLNVQNANIKDILNLLAEVSGKNFIMGTAAQAQPITLNIKNTPWDQVFSIILLNAKLGYQIIGNTYRIMPVAALKSEVEQAANAAKTIEEVAPLTTRIIPLNYARAETISTNLETLKTERGKVSTDARVNSIIMTDTLASIKRVEKYIQAVDRQTPQVLIRSRIVEATKGFSRDFGINWRVGPYANRSNGAAIPPNTPRPSTGRPYDPDFTGSTGQFGAIAAAGGNPNTLDIRAGTVGGIDAIIAQLNATENNSNAKIIAAPYITTSDNVQATLSQGEEIVVQGTGTEGGVNFETLSATLTLNVTPQVSADGFVNMNIDLSQREIKSTNPSPSFTTKSAKTQLLVKSNDTAVIGGIYTKRKTNAKVGLPFLNKIPVVGALFNHTNSVTDNLGELLMFISPRIINPRESMIQGRQLETLDEEQIVSGK